MQEIKHLIFIFSLKKWIQVECLYTAISIKVVPQQTGKVEYERERLLGIANKFINFLAIPSSLSHSYSTFPLCSWTTLIEIAVFTACINVQCI
jgi:hypothetical protein